MTTRTSEATVFRLTHPFRIEAFEEQTELPEPGWLRLRPLRLGICGSDLKLYTGTRERSAMIKKLPLTLLHEGVAEVVAVGAGVPFSVGQRVVPSPNIPCTIAHPGRYASIDEACYACRPGGAGENYCMDGNFLSSNVDGMARTEFLHPAACTIAVPPEASETLAVLMEPFATVLAGLEHASAASDALFLVLGNGAIGILTAIALRATLGAGPDQIIMTGRHWDARAGVVEGLATPVEEDGGALASDIAGRVDVAFECVGGESNDETLATAIDMLKPGGKGIMFGPSEGPFLFDTRKVIAKGLVIAGCNRALTKHFSDALSLAGEPKLWNLLERALAPKEFAVRTARDLDDALYCAWTKTDAGRTVTTW
ncbi:MAG: alcohol dehydrogenase catalytic domain-containing protein [Actinomycetota bacterium]|nr:alcohol dehydrogenase catalytic domain-containing protein [Actinomycetota bacterium]